MPQPQWSDQVLAGAQREGALVWLSAWQQRETDKVVEAFTRRFPFVHLQARRVSHPFGLIENERTARRPTIDTAGPVTGAIVAQMAQQGFWLAYRSPFVEDLDPIFSDSAGHWYSTHSMGMAMAYNKNLVPVDQIPRGYDDLLHPRWEGRILMEDIRHWGTSAEWALGVRQRMGEAWFEKLAKHDVQWYIEGAVTGALDAISAGKYPIAPWAVDYMVQLRVGASEPLGWTNPERLGRVPANVILATAPHPNAARLFADWLMAEEGQTLIGQENLGFPARPGVPCYMAQFYPAGVRFQINRPDEVARQKKSLVEMYQRLFFGERR